MISSAGYRKVKVLITTFQREDSRKQTNYIMDKEKHRHSIIGESNRRFVCSVCLNSHDPHKYNSDNARAKPCPICCKAYDGKRCDRAHTKIDNKDDMFCTYDHTDTYNNNGREKKNNITNNHGKEDRSNRADNTKIVQTSRTDLTQDISLLKEVLTVFRSKKQIEAQSTTSKVVLMKNVSVATDQSKMDFKPMLTKSKIFQLSIDDNNMGSNKNHDFKVYSQPDNKKSSQYSIHLTKHKSSSIPQMKLEELKYSLKEKTKSKDAIEEVNRMFATVRRSEPSKNLVDNNRPVVRSGPRVLPVVKTNVNTENTKGNSDSEVENKNASNKDLTCKCCQTNNIHLSGGDSLFKHECCYHKILHEEKCEKCVYMLCCHYQNHSKVEAGALVCESCRIPEKSQESQAEKHCRGVCGENSQCKHF